MILLHVALFVLGAAIVVSTVLSSILTFVLPRGVLVRITRLVFITTRGVFNLMALRVATYEERDHIMALYAPLTLVILPLVWLVLVLSGYMAMYFAWGIDGWQHAFSVSGSSLLTLGFTPVTTFPQTVLAFSEAAIGLLLVALLIAYLPTMYTTWARREAMVATLEVRAGSPPSSAEMITRFYRLGRLENLADLWPAWETWFTDLEESHTSLAPLLFFRSPQPDRSWITAAGVVLDTASLAASTLDIPRTPQTDLCLRAGYLCLRRIAGLLQMPLDPVPPIGADNIVSITRQEYDAVCDGLAELGVPLLPNRDQTWRDFAGWRVTYDTPLLGLAAVTMAPYAQWVSDRSLKQVRPRLWQKRT